MKLLNMAATYTVKQVAQILGYSTNSIYTFLKAKRIKGVRVGKGRFRIPQGELNRLLLTGKDKIVSTPAYVEKDLTDAAFAPVVLPSGVVEAPQDGVIPSGFLPNVPRGRVEVPSLFDWFTGMGSVILGLAMFLFSRVYEEFSFEQFLPWIPALRVTLIAAGFGLLLTDVVGRKFSLWHKIFHWILVVAYAGYAGILISTGNWEGAVIFGVLAVALVVTFFVQIGGVAGFSLYVVGVSALMPSVAVFAQQKSTLLPLLSQVPIPVGVFANLWMIIVLVVGFVIWIGYMRDRRVFWMGMFGVSGFLILLSVYYAQNLAWGRSLFILLVGLLSFFVPVWQTLTFTHKRDRSFVFGAFGSLLILFIVAIGMIRVMQTNIIDYASRELTNKVSYGKALLETTILSTKSSLSSAATNSLWVGAIERSQTDDLISLSRSLFEGNPMLRRIVAIARDGEPLATYPYGETEKTNFALRDYVIAAITTKKPATSDIFEVASDQTKRKVVVVAAPVLDRTQTVIGVILGTIDLETLGHKVQQIASAKIGEYFVVIDRAGRRIIDADTKLFGTQVDEKDPIRLALTGVSGVREGYSSKGIRTLIAFDGTDDGTVWGIAVKAPLSSILGATNAGGITIFAVILLSVLIIAVFLLSHRTRTQVGEELAVPVRSPVPRERIGEVLSRHAAKRRRMRKDSS